jgi:hypothetical protein
LKNLWKDLQGMGETGIGVNEAHESPANNLRKQAEQGGRRDVLGLC